MAGYADNLLKKGERQLPEGMDLQDWLSAHEPSLRADPHQRALNGLVAIGLLPPFQRGPEHWGCVRHLPRSDSNLAEYLAEWEEACPDRHKRFIADLRAALGSAGT